MYPLRESEPDVQAYPVTITGPGTSLTHAGAGTTVTRTGVGAYLITWTNDPGVFQGFKWALGAVTPANLRGHTMVRGAYDRVTKSMPVVLYNAADAAHELAANEFIDLEVKFQA